MRDVGLPARSNFEQTLSVGGFCELVQDTLQRGIGKVWIRGVIQRINESRGHRYIELVERTGPGGLTGDIVAQLEVAIFAQTYSVIARQIAKSGMESLRPGLVIRVKGRPNLYTQRGKFSFVVDEIDLTATMEARVLERERIRAHLLELGVLEHNLRLQVASVVQSVAIVGSSAGVVKGDFLGQLNESGLRLSVHLFDVSTTGDTAAASIASAVNSASTAGYDLIVLLRGGGSSAELSPYESEQVVLAVAKSRVPVWCGIGHSSDRPLVNEVSNRSFDVPLAVGAAIVDHNLAFLDALGVLASVVRDLAFKRIHAENYLLIESSRALERRSREVLTRELSDSGSWYRVKVQVERLTNLWRQELKGSVYRIRSRSMEISSLAALDRKTTFAELGRSVGRIVEEAKASIGTLDRLSSRSKQLIYFESEAISRAELRLAVNDIDAVLSMGFVAVESKTTGMRVVRAGDLVAGEEIRMHFVDGAAEGVVRGIEPSVEP